MTGLPEGVRQRLDALLEGRSRRDLAARSAAITTTYRNRRNSSGVVCSAEDALAYAVARMPATHAAMVHALDALARAAPGLSLRSQLDAGCGTGAATIAAHAVWPDIGRFTLLDRSGPFLDLARELTGPIAASADLTISPAELTDASDLPAADLVTAGYVMAELGEGPALALGRRLWAATGEALVITEPGTPDGFARLRALRALLLADGAHVAAPCTHHAPCPMTEGGWCRVPVRVQRSRDHMALKGATLGHEDEPVAYLAVTREPPPARPAHRIVGPASASKIEIALPVCGKDGLSSLTAARRIGEKYKEFRRLDWGDAVWIPEARAGIERR